MALPLRTHPVTQVLEFVGRERVYGAGGVEVATWIHVEVCVEEVSPRSATHRDMPVAVWTQTCVRLGGIECMAVCHRNSCC